MQHKTTQTRSNPVAKYAKKYNVATVQEDRKKAAKRGKVKHKGKHLT